MRREQLEHPLGRGVGDCQDGAGRARAKGLEQPYITGGEAPDEEEARAEERRLGRWLLLMVVVIVAAGFVLGAIAAIFGVAVAQ